MNFVFNLIILVIVGGITLRLASQGAFTAMLQLVGVIVAGALAFGLWEKVAYLVFKSPGDLRHTWGVSLLLTFSVVLLTYRLIVDRWIKGNLHFPLMADRLVGGALGLFAAMLTAGMLVLGISFMHWPASFLGYQIAQVEANGTIAPNPGGRLYLPPVDSITDGWFSMLSKGSFSSRTPLYKYQPSTRWQGQLFRLNSDRWASPIAKPGSISVSNYALLTTPLDSQGGGQFDPSFLQLISGVPAAGGLADGSYRLAVVATRWDGSIGTYDSSGLRVPPTQVWLVAVSPWGQVHMEPPVAASVALGDQARDFVAFDSDRAEVTSTNVSGGDEITWAFAVSGDDQPLAVIIRHERLLLGDAPSKDYAAASRWLMGSSVEVATTNVEPFREATVTDRLLVSFSRNNATGLTYDETQKKIVSGTALVQNTRGGGAATMVGLVDCPSHMAMLRVTFDYAQANAAFGGLDVATADMQTVWVRDSNGNELRPSAYVAQLGKTLSVRVESSGVIDSGRELPVSRMRANDALALYFRVARGSRVTDFKFGRVQGYFEEPITMETGR